MATQKHMGRNSLVKRLTAQIGDEGKALAVLQKRGHMNKDGTLTPAGKKRDNMTAAERAKDRAAKRQGKRPSAFLYNPKNNSAKLKSGR